MRSSVSFSPSAAAPGPAGGSFGAVFGTIVALLAFVAWEQSFWWQSHEDYRFGWLAPVFVAYALFRNRRTIRAELDTARTGRTGGPSRLALWSARFALGGGLVLFVFGALARANAGPSHPVTLAIAIGAAAMILSLVYLSAPAEAGAGQAAGSSRRRLVLLFVYPATVWLLTAPLLSALELRLSSVLLQQIARVVLGVFHLLDLPVELKGNVFVMRGGPVGIDEACLGLRSLTGCLFGGFFLAEVSLVRWSMRGILLVAALALALVTNLGRVLFLNLYAYKYGPASVEGFVHDVAGWSVWGLTALALFGVLACLERREARRARA